MQRDEERKADAKDGEGNEEVAVSEDRPGLLKKFHRRPLELHWFGWRKHKDAVGWMSR